MREAYEILIYNEATKSKKRETSMGTPYRVMQTEHGWVSVPNGSYSAHVCTGEQFLVYAEKRPETGYVVLTEATTGLSCNTAFNRYQTHKAALNHLCTYGTSDCTDADRVVERLRKAERL